MYGDQTDFFLAQFCYVVLDISTESLFIRFVLNWAKLLEIFQKNNLRRSAKCPHYILEDSLREVYFLEL